ncbi:MAG: glycosyl transferase family 1, partial [Candidatus Latescibacterota bacterium]
MIEDENKMKKSVLIVAYHFPPAGGAGVQRLLKFVKYLPQYGWEPIVVTAKKPSVPCYDPSLLTEIPAECHVMRIPTLEVPYGQKQKVWQKIAPDGKETRVRAKQIIKHVAQSIFIPDYQVGWVPFAVNACLKVMKSRSIDVVFISAPPFSNLLVGVILKIITRKKWVADFRDEWTGFYDRFYETH